MYKHLLVPLDDSMLSGATVEQAASFARSIGARITFVHVRADFAGSSDGALIEVMNPDAFTEAALGNAQGLLAKAKSAAIAAGVDAATVIRVGNKPAMTILEVATQQQCDLIFMASHGRRGINGMIQGSVTHKLLQNATLPVLVSQVESNTELSTQEQAITIIKNEHRALSAVVRGLQQRLTELDDEPEEADFALLMAMLFYIEDYSERLHHPKEDDYLFTALRQRTSDFGGVLAELEQQHQQETPIMDKLRQQLADYVAGQEGAGNAFTETLNRFAEQQWKHMASEEQLIIPAAREHLLPSDWDEIAQAFAVNGDPQFNVDKRASFERLFTRLMNQVTVNHD
ncbi:universal stress protein [Amphritea sp.]|uniref:universal stress protein n=1 Tax=Amphritea sp. TaxID=1872502 RepID=UPI003A8FDB8D